MAPGKAPVLEELPGPLPTDVPAGGLDVAVAPPRKPGQAEAEEAVSADSSLSVDERNRWLILHFALPRTIMTYDAVDGRSTEAELNDLLSAMAWGSIDAETREWILETEEAATEPHHSSLISYAEFLDRTYPSDHTIEEKIRSENIATVAQKRAAFTNPGEPGAKFRPVFDQLVKGLAHSNKALMKAYDLKKPILNEADVPENPALSEAQNIMRYARHQILPAFWQLLAQLTRRSRRFSVVFRTFSEEQLRVVQQELQLFCQGQHPAYDGKNKTQKPPPMSGEKGSRDMRLIDASIGRLDRFAGRLEFATRPAGDAPKTARPGEVIAGTPPPPAGAADAAEEGVEVEFRPTVYNFPDYHEVYAGLQHQVLDGANTAAIVDDLGYWKAKEEDPSSGKLLLVDHSRGMAETKVHHIFFDGYMRPGNPHCVDVRDVVSGESVPYAEAEGVYTHRVDLFQAALDPDYFVKAVEACEAKFTQRVLDSRKVAGALPEAEQQGASAEKLPPKEYLYRNIIPALLPALEACQRDRPADPIEFIAFYMLRHSKQYTKTLKA